MKTMIIGMIAVVGLLGGILFITQGEPTTNQNTATDVLSIQTVVEDVQTGGQLTDVRTPEEFNAGYINGALNLPLQEIQAGVHPTVDRDEPVYVYCRSGNRSAQASSLLEGAGFTNVIDLGGIQDVQDLGGKIVTN